MRTTAASQWSSAPNRGEKAWLKMGVIGDSAEGSERVSLDIPESDALFLEQLAEYRNALARVQQKKVRRQSSRKSVGEEAIRDWCDNSRAEFEPAFEACGPMPVPQRDKDGKLLNTEDFERFARKVLAWDRKGTK